MLPLKKLYIDSRDRTPDSVRASNFKIALPYTIHMPDNTVFFLPMFASHMYGKQLKHILMIDYIYIIKHLQDLYQFN